MTKRADPVSDARVPLSRDRVLGAAISIADKEGIDSLTMRRLAQELGVEAMSLYYYVASKDDMLTGMLDLVLREIEPPLGGVDWKAAIRRGAISFHAALSRHRWAHGLMSSPRKLPVAQLRYMEALLRCLREAGFSANMTHHAYHVLDSHVIGSALWEAGIAAAIPKERRLADVAEDFLKQLPIAEYPYFYEHVEQHLNKSVSDGRNTFEFGLDLILDGLERIRRSTRPRRRGR